MTDLDRTELLDAVNSITAGLSTLAAMVAQLLDQDRKIQDQILRRLTAVEEKLRITGDS